VKAELTFTEFVNAFLDEYLETGAMTNYSVFVCREDGHLVYNRDHMKMGVKHSSIAALLGGVWQAASTLASFITKEEKQDLFRLSFDTSSQGIYILPFEQNNEKYSLCLLYKNEINPGFLKSRLRELLMRMTGEMKCLNLKELRSNKGFMFSDITDEEMDKVFNINEDDRCHS
jgi:hypothetical protein